MEVSVVQERNANGFIQGQPALEQRAHGLPSFSVRAWIVDLLHPRSLGYEPGGVLVVPLR
ncbi:MAG TPA: hypothetical protein VJZ71_02180 [Phycisphaerae bacterium]|nr:hypothetical protein [Phycisphaerae bacterium]